MGGLFSAVPGGFVPEEDQGYFLVNIQLPDAASLERTDAVNKKVEQIILNTQGVESVTAVSGFSLLTAALSSNNAFLFVSLKHWQERDSSDLHVRAIIEKVNQQLALGISPADVNTTLGSFLGGAYVNDFNRFGRLYKVYVQAEPEYRSDPSDIRFYFVRGKQGQVVPLSALVSTSPTHGPEYTNRFNLFRAAELTGAPAPGFSSDQALNALEAVADNVLPTDMTYAWNAMSFQERAAAGSGAMVFVLALLFVFLILAAQYESWSLPLGVLLGTPIAIFGAMLGLWLAGLFLPGYQNNVFAQIGLVMLIGMAAKNAILIVEFAKLKSEEGMSAFDAALAAARDRFRPILMTAFSFILGVLPLLVASGAGAALGFVRADQFPNLDGAAA